MIAIPVVILDGASNARALWAELVTDKIVATVTGAIEHFGRDIVAIVDAEHVVIADRAKAETDPALPEAMRWLRGAARGSWIVALRSDGARVRARIRMAPASKGGAA